MYALVSLCRFPDDCATITTIHLQNVFHLARPKLSHSNCGCFVVTVVFFPSGTPRTLSPLRSHLSWSAAAFLQVAHPFFQPPPLVLAGWGGVGGGGWPFLGYLLGGTLAGHDFGSSFAGFHVSEAMEIPVVVMPTSPRACFPGKGHHSGLGQQSAAEWPTEGRVDDLCPAASLQHCPKEDPRSVKIHFALTQEKFRYSLCCDLVPRFQTPGTEPCTSMP